MMLDKKKKLFLNDHLISPEAKLIHGNMLPVPRQNKSMVNMPPAQTALGNHAVVYGKETLWNVSFREVDD